VVVPGYEDSLLIKHPLAEAAGGDARHGGGQQFASKDDRLEDFEGMGDGGEVNLRSPDERTCLLMKPSGGKSGL
jgi:hypothetical protein